MPVLSNYVTVPARLEPSVYHVLEELAKQKSRPGRPVQVHHLLEQLAGEAVVRMTRQPAEQRTGAGRLTRKASAELHSKILAHHVAGHAVKHIAEACGCTEKTVYNVLRGRGLTPNRQHSDLRIEVARLHHKGWTDRRIAEKTGRNIETVGQARRRLRLAPNKEAGK